VSKLAEKKIGLLNKQNKLERKQGNIIPEQTFNETTNDRMKKKKNEFKNQKGSIKVPMSTKGELAALKDITKTKTDYEMIQMLIDSYVPTMETAKQKRFRLLTEEEI
jgi:hypothetical protein